MPSPQKVAKRKPAPKIRALDLFCGAGGSSLGARAAGVQIVGGVDLSNLAEKVYKDNFPKAHFFRRRIEGLSASAVKREVGPVQLLLASPECTNHSCAKGAKRRSEASRQTAFEVLRFAKAFKPRWIVVENVIQMKSWAKYAKWLRRLEGLGYKTTEHVLNAANFGVPQARKRLFILADLLRKPPSEIGIQDGRVPVRKVLNMNGVYAYSPLRKKGRAKRTLRHAMRAMRHVGTKRPFIVVYYGSDGAGGWQRLTEPLRTVTTLDRFALVRRIDGGHKMRMLQVPELWAAMGFPDDFKLNHGVRRERIGLFGNAVCPPVMTAIIKTLVSANGEAARRNDG
jgi:DNA (cytosine-5)-methyltransferase 1